MNISLFPYTTLVRSAVHPAVTIGILQHHDTTLRYPFAKRGLFIAHVVDGHVGDHLRYPEAPVTVDIHRHRIHDVRLMRHQFNPETLLTLERLQSLFRRENRTETIVFILSVGLRVGYPP